MSKEEELRAELVSLKNREKEINEELDKIVLIETTKNLVDKWFFKGAMGYDELIHITDVTNKEIIAQKWTLTYTKIGNTSVSYNPYAHLEHAAFSKDAFMLFDEITKEAALNQVARFINWLKI